MMQISSFRAQTKKLVSAIGQKETNRFQQLAFRIILGINETKSEFFSAQRKYSLDTPEYEALKTFRQSMYYNPTFSRLWRAIYSLVTNTQGQWTHDKKGVDSCANWFLVSNEDLMDLFHFWNENDKPDLGSLMASDEEAIILRVDAKNITLSASLWSRIDRRCRTAILSQKYSYLTKFGHYTYEDLHSDLLQHAVCRAMALDWMPEDKRFIVTCAAINSFICDLAKKATTKKRSKVEANKSAIKTSFQVKSGVVNFSNVEKRIVNALVYKECDEEILTLLEGADVRDWAEWLCEQLEVDWESFSAKLIIRKPVTTFTARVVNIESLITEERTLDKLHELADGSVAAQAASDFDHSLAKVSNKLSTNEQRIINAVAYGEMDEELEEMMEGAAPEDWAEWLCDQLDVDFRSLKAKLARALMVTA